ncbi:MAG TPA: aminotransferase class V-fold PLP-dependent enzyme [Aggregatilineaceae bacterium]|nr:aminotransferase class V-fold PLP-dependent enzyme [Aggregatilineaceae bacterium]
MSHLPSYNVESVRRSFPIAQHFTYLNHASISPIPHPAHEVMVQVAHRLADDPMSFYAPGGDDMFVMFSTEMAQLIHAEQWDDVVGVPSTSTALNMVAQSIQWQAGDNVVLCNVEFPSNVYPWMALQREGVEIRLAESATWGASLDEIAAQVTNRTRLIAVSAVQFLSGHRADLATIGAFCRERGILFAVDAIQAAGHIPLDVQAMQIDILAAGGQKSLMGPPGQGFLYVRRAICDEMQFGPIGPVSVEGWEHWLKYDVTPRAGAFRFMMGTVNIPGMFGLVESVRFLRQLGLENIDAWTKHLTQIALEDLTARGYAVITPTDPAHQGPILTFGVGNPGNPAKADAHATALHQYFSQHNVRLTKHLDATGMPYLRLSMHCYNTENEVLQVGRLLGEYRR